MVPAINPEGILSVEFKPHDEMFVKKVYVPYATILFLQNRPASLKNLTLKEMIGYISEAGWEEDAMKMEKRDCITLENIPIYLQRVNFFLIQIEELFFWETPLHPLVFFKEQESIFVLKRRDTQENYFALGHKNRPINSLIAIWKKKSNG